MKREEQLFTQSVTSDYFFVSEETHVNITDVETIRGDYAFYIKWKNKGIEHTKFLSVKNIRYIVKAHEEWLGIKSHSYIEWITTLNDAITKENLMKKVGN